MSSAPPLDRETRAYLADSYPRNHNYRVVGRRLLPSFRLWRRDRRLRALYPTRPASLVDLSSNKGWFCLTAAARFGGARVLGIDVDAEAVRASRAVRDHLELADVRLEVLRLEELAARIDAFGGPFEVALLVNVYHYLYFGSRDDPHHLDSHDAIFDALRAVCSGTLVFSNCTSLEQLPNNVRERARAQGRATGYDTSSLRAAAERRFRVEEHGHLGRRPLWRLTAR